MGSSRRKGRPTRRSAIPRFRHCPRRLADQRPVRGVPVAALRKLMYSPRSGCCPDFDLAAARVREPVATGPFCSRLAPGKSDCAATTLVLRGWPREAVRSRRVQLCHLEGQDRQGVAADRVSLVPRERGVEGTALRARGRIPARLVSQRGAVRRSTDRLLQARPPSRKFTTNLVETYDTVTGPVPVAPAYAPVPPWIRVDPERTLFPAALMSALATNTLPAGVFRL